MNKFKKLNYSWLLILFFCLFMVSAQSQTNQPEVTLTWSTNAYTPVNYPGKALPTINSQVEVAANLDNQSINPEDLVYNWFLNNSFQKEASGLGKSVFKFKFKESFSRKYTLQLKIKNKQGQSIAISSILYLKAVQPKVILQTENPDYQFSPGEQSIITAQPYFFNIKDIQDLDYNWTLDGESPQQTNPSQPNLLILKIGQIGQSLKKNLIVQVENKKSPLERARLAVELNFNP